MCTLLTPGCTESQQASRYCYSVLGIMIIVIGNGIDDLLVEILHFTSEKA